MIYSFPPINAAHGKSPNVLILGSIPGKASLEAQQYYAHPRNAFWKLMNALFRIPLDSSYEQRCHLLTQHKIAVWDVLQACVRPSSLDSDIDLNTIVPNDFNAFFEKNNEIRAVFLTAQQPKNCLKSMYFQAFPPLYKLFNSNACLLLAQPTLQ